ncbi:MAG: extracellular solute-binding protein, partial [Chloroflexota bacterium]
MRPPVPLTRRALGRTGARVAGGGLVLTALTAAACGVPGSAPEPAEATAIEFWHFWDEEDYQQFEPFLAEFRQRNPKVQVNPVAQAGGGSGMNEKLTAAVVSDTPPDLATMFPRYLARLIEGNAIVPWEISAADKKDIYESVQQVFAYRGKTWAIPIEHSLYGLYWNRKLFREASLSAPPKTLQELVDFGKRIARDTDGDGKLDQWGFRDDGPTTIFNFYFSNQVRFVSEDGKKVLFDSPAMVDVLEFWNDLVRRHRVTDFPMPSRDMWHADRVGLMIAGSWRLQENVQQGRDFDTARIPKWKVDATEAAPDCLAILNTTRDKIAASQKLANWMCSKEVFTTLALKNHYLPIRKSILESPEYQQYIKQVPQVKGLIEMIPFEQAKPLHPVWREIEGELGKMREQVEKGEATPK